jgi:hypothetical protein
MVSPLQLKVYPKKEFGRRFIVSDFRVWVAVIYEINASLMEKKSKSGTVKFNMKQTS